MDAALAAVESTATTVKLKLMGIISLKIREKYGTQSGAWSRAADEMDVSAETLSRIHRGVHDQFSIGWLFAFADRVGAKVTVKID